MRLTPPGRGSPPIVSSHLLRYDQGFRPCGNVAPTGAAHLIVEVTKNERGENGGQEAGQHVAQELHHRQSPPSGGLPRGQINPFRRDAQLLARLARSLPEYKGLHGIEQQESGPAPAARLARPSGRDHLDLEALDAALHRAEDLSASYNMAMRDMVKELRTPFGAARQDEQLQEPVRTFATSVLYGLSDLQTACAVVHNATLSTVRMAVDGCRILETLR